MNPNFRRRYEGLKRREMIRNRKRLVLADDRSLGPILPLCLANMFMGDTETSSLGSSTYILRQITTNQYHASALEPRYGYYICFFAATLSLFIASSRFLSLTRRSMRLSTTLATLRLLLYRRISVLPGVGYLFITIPFAVFVVCLTFGSTSYADGQFGSYPIGLRSGWMATAMLPWIIMLAVKRNALSSLTGVSYEKLLILHPWVGWISLLLSLVHTIALIIKADRNGSWSLAMANVRYKSGFGAIAPLLWLCIMSLGPIRHRFYEFFYITHILAVALFLGWMAAHVAFLHGSQYYVYVTVALWAFAVMWRHGVVLLHLLRNLLRERGFDRATVPGQHVFLRFPSCRPMESHPFTIMSISTSPTKSNADIEKNLERLNTSSHAGSASEKTAKVPCTHASGPVNQLEILMRVGTGFTSALRQKVIKERVTGQPLVLPVILDGPYGGPSADIASFDSVLLVAGGTGVTFALSILEDLVLGPHDSRPASVELVWVTNDIGLIATLLPKLRTIATHPGIFEVRISLYTTDSNESEPGLNLTFVKELGTEDPVSASTQITKPVRAAMRFPPPPVKSYSQPIRGRPRADSDATVVAELEQPELALERGRPNIKTIV